MPSNTTLIIQRLNQEYKELAMIFTNCLIGAVYSREIRRGTLSIIQSATAVTAQSHDESGCLARSLNTVNWLV